MYKIIITMTSNIAMSHREEEKLKQYFDGEGFETIRVEQKEVEPKAGDQTR